MVALLGTLLFIVKFTELLSSCFYEISTAEGLEKRVIFITEEGDLPSILWLVKGV